MGKLRIHDGDTAVGMAQWIGRKVRHHDPLSEVDDFKTTRQSGHLRVGVVKEEPLKVIYLIGGGQRYGITVREVEPDEPVKKLVAVGA